MVFSVNTRLQPALQDDQHHIPAGHLQTLRGAFTPRMW